MFFWIMLGLGVGVGWGALTARQDLCSTGNKTGLQPVLRPVELVHYFGGWVECPSKQTDRTDGGWVQSSFWSQG